MKQDLTNWVLRTLVAWVIWEHTFLLARLIAINEFPVFITSYKVRESDKTVKARESLELSNFNV